MAQELTRRRFAVGAAAIAGGALVAGASVSSVAAASSRFSNPAVIHAQNAPVEVVFHHIWGTPPGEQAPEKKNAAMQLIDAFNESQSDVKLISRTDTGDYYQNLQKTQAELAAGNPPDLVSVPWAFVDWATQGLGLVALEDAVGADQVKPVFSNLRDQVLPLVTLDGKTMGMPFAFSTPAFYYNVEMLDKAGVKAEDLMADWLTFNDKAKAVTEANGVPTLSMMGNWIAQGIIQSNGGRVLNDEGEFGITMPESIEAMATINGIHEAGNKITGTSSELYQSFLAGTIAMHHGSIASLSGIRANATMDFGTVGVPHFGDKKRWMSCGGSFIGMFAQDPTKQQAAFEFQKYALSEPGYTIWNQYGYLNATKYDLPILPGQEAAYATLEEGINAETPWPGERGGEIADTWNTYVNRIWDGDIDAESGCNEALSEMNAIRG
ncbi:MAG: extracellular solute-binding protein [Thermomicrobiales bacterium]